MHATIVSIIRVLLFVAGLFKLYLKSAVYIKNRKGANTVSCGAPVLLLTVPVCNPGVGGIEFCFKSRKKVAHIAS